MRLSNPCGVARAAARAAGAVASAPPAPLVGTSRRRRGAASAAAPQRRFQAAAAAGLKSAVAGASGAVEPAARPPAPELVVRDSQRIEVYPGRLAVVASACELRGLPPAAEGAAPDALLYWRLDTSGVAGAHGLPELSFVRPRDLLRPRDHTHALGLMQTLFKMLDDGAHLDEGTVVPVETHRKQKRPELQQRPGAEGVPVGHPAELDEGEEPDAYLAFYPHPERSEVLSMLLLPPGLYALAERFSTPLRATNLLFKHGLWHLLPPAVYRAPQPPAPELLAGSVLAALPENRAVIAGEEAVTATVTLQGGRLLASLPRAAAAPAQAAAQQAQAAGAGAELLLVASRHAAGVDGVLVWDPARPLDSWAVGTRPGLPNWNSAEDAGGSARIGATFALLRCAPEGGPAGGELQMEEDGARAVLAPADFGALCRALAEGAQCDTELVALRWHGDREQPQPAADPADGGDWLAYVKGRIAEHGTPEHPAAAPAVPRRRSGRRVDLEGAGPQMTLVGSEAAPDGPPPAATERSGAESRVVGIEFGVPPEDPRVSGDEQAWGAYAARVCVVVNAVCDHFGEPRAGGGPAPTGGEDDGCLVVRALPSGDGAAELTAEMVFPERCSVELPPQALGELSSRLARHCGRLPHDIPVALIIAC